MDLYVYDESKSTADVMYPILQIKNRKQELFLSLSSAVEDQNTLIVLEKDLLYNSKI